MFTSELYQRVATTNDSIANLDWIGLSIDRQNMTCSECKEYAMSFLTSACAKFIVFVGVVQSKSRRGNLFML